MRREPMPAPPGWKMQLFEVVPGLFIGTRLKALGTEYATLNVDVIVDLEDWETPGRRPFRSANST